MAYIKNNIHIAALQTQYMSIQMYCTSTTLKKMVTFQQHPKTYLWNTSQKRYNTIQQKTQQTDRQNKCGSNSRQK